MATITTTTPADILGLAFANAHTCFTFSMVPPNYSYFCLNQSAYHYHKTIHKTKSLCRLVYRYIFCPPSRRLKQIIKRVLKIIYSLFLLIFRKTGCNAFRSNKTLFISQRFGAILLVFLLTAFSVVFFFF